MNITPINKIYTAPKNMHALNFGSKAGANVGQAENNFCQKTIVKNTLKEFSNSRGQYLADIDLSDIYIPNSSKKNEKVFSDNKTIVQSTPIVFGRAVKCLADQPLADTFELQQPKKKQDKNLQIPFGGAYPQYLIDQDGVVEDYECTSNGIQDIAYSSYCKPASYSFKGKEKNILQKICKTLKEYLPL